jgi:hypothetical protein
MAIASDYDPPAEKASVVLLFLSITVLTLTYVCYELLKGLKSGKPVERLYRVASEYHRTLFAFDKEIPPLAALAKKLPSSAAIAASSPKTSHKKKESNQSPVATQTPSLPNAGDQKKTRVLFLKGAEWALGGIDAAWELAVDSTALTINKTLIRPAKWSAKNLEHLAQKSPLKLFFSKDQ